MNIFLVCNLFYQKYKLYVINLNITHKFTFPQFESWSEDQNIYGNYV